MIGLLLYLLIIGIIAGYLARLLVPGPDPMGFVGTVVLGVIGSIRRRAPGEPHLRR